MWLRSPVFVCVFSLLSLILISLSDLAIAHWQREFERWSSESSVLFRLFAVVVLAIVMSDIALSLVAMNALVYHGNRTAKRNIVHYEWSNPNARDEKGQVLSCAFIVCAIVSSLDHIYSS